uniref:Uncharacterized protein n=1 Tax=Rhizophora mucronata TaxID=61149 RepID=A0A2P2QP52_RHIMU
MLTKGKKGIHDYLLQRDNNDRREKILNAYGNMRIKSRPLKCPTNFCLTIHSSTMQILTNRECQ